MTYVNMNDAVHYIGTQIRGSNLGEGWWELAKPPKRFPDGLYTYTQQWIWAYEDQIAEFLKMNGVVDGVPILATVVYGWVDSIWEESGKWGEKYLGHFAAVPLTASTYIPVDQSSHTEATAPRVSRRWWLRLVSWGEVGKRGDRSHGSSGVQSCTLANKLRVGEESADGVYDWTKKRFERSS